MLRDPFTQLEAFLFQKMFCIILFDRNSQEPLKTKTELSLKRNRTTRQECENSWIMIQVA